MILPSTKSSFFPVIFIFLVVSHLVGVPCLLREGAHVLVGVLAILVALCEATSSVGGAAAGLQLPNDGLWTGWA